MATRRKSTPKPEIGAPEVSPDVGIGLLNKLISSGKELLSSRPLSSDAYSRWETLTRNYLEKAFGKNSPNVRTVTSIGMYGSFPMNASPAWWEQHRCESLQSQLSQLEGLIELLETEQQISGTSHSVVHKATEYFGHRIFLVHGHNERTLHETARFLENLDQEIVILREQPNGGRTIIEKFESYSEVGFAIVLLTPDDRGGTIGSEIDKQMPRARQNVIFELGYFIGKLGRNRVCALYHPGVEIPSDYSGVLYEELDEKGAWRLKLAKELRAAGFPVDMNKAL